MGILKLNRKEKDIWSSIQPGDKAQVFLGKEKNRNFETKVSDINDTNIFVETPTLGKAYLELSRKTKVILEIEMQASRFGKIRFVSWVRGQEWLKKSIVKIACPRKIKLLELRRKYRVGVSLPGKFSFVDENTIIGDLELKTPIYHTEVKNISEGGALIVAEKLTSVKTGDLINLKSELGLEKDWKARARIAHIEIAQTKYGLGIEWVFLKANQAKVLKDFITAQIKDKSTN